MFSLLLIGLLAAMFAGDIYTVLAKQDITSTTIVTVFLYLSKDSPSSAKEISNFYLAANIDFVNQT